MRFAFILLALALAVGGCAKTICDVDSGGATAGTSTGEECPDVCPFASECSAGATPGQEKAACDDANADTIDRCVSAFICGGLCAHIPGQCDHLDPDTTQQNRCNDSNACTADRCDAANTCLRDPVPDGTLCGSGTCQDGVCVFG